jgi:hypothetical protein
MDSLPACVRGFAVAKVSIRLRTIEDLQAALADSAVARRAT